MTKALKPQSHGWAWGQATGICPRISAAVGKASISTDLINQFSELVNGLHLHGVYIASHRIMPGKPQPQASLGIV